MKSYNVDHLIPDSSSKTTVGCHSRIINFFSFSAATYQSSTSGFTPIYNTGNFGHGYAAAASQPQQVKLSQNLNYNRIIKLFRESEGENDGKWHENIWKLSFQ